MNARTPPQSLGNYGHYRAALNHRESSGQAEVHDAVADLFVIESGEATLVVGGRGVGLKKTTAGEWRGSGIEGGEKRRLGPGDIVHIPPRTPHQFLLEPGAKITYFTLKVDSKI